MSHINQTKAELEFEALKERHPTDVMARLALKFRSSYRPQRVAELLQVDWRRSVESLSSELGVPIHQVQQLKKARRNQKKTT